MQDSPSNPYYRSLTRKMVLLVIVVSVTPMLAASGMILEQFRSSYLDKVNAHLAELVSKHKQNVDTFLRDKLNLIRFIARTTSPDQLERTDYLQSLLADLQQQIGPVFVDLGFIDPQGRQAAYAGPFKLGQARYNDAPWFREAMQSDCYISDVFLGLRGLPHFIVAVQRPWHESTWLLRATIDFVAFNNLVENIHIGKTGTAFIVNRQGTLQTRPLSGASPSEWPDLPLLGEMKAAENPLHIVATKGSDGVKRIYVATLLNDGHWLLVYQQDWADAFAELQQTQNMALLVLIMGGVAIVSVAFILTRRLVLQIARADSEKELMNQQVIETGKLASVGELAAGIAHEINNPVAIMVEEAGWIRDLLEEDGFRSAADLEELRRALRQINAQGKRCKEITQKLLSFARRSDARVSDIQINQLIEEILGLSAQRAKYSNVQLNAALDPDLPLIQASVSEMQQVFLNLLNNSLDALESRGGHIGIRTQRVGREVWIVFSDDGPGIPPANLQRVFDPFFTTKPVGKGTGLGLSICYGIVKKLGGEIEVESGVEKGTVFRIRIPLADSDSLEDGVARPVAA